MSTVKGDWYILSDMNDDFVKNALSNGAEGKLWLETIPKIIEEYSKKWRIVVSPPYKLSYNYVAPAVTSDGDEVVLKIGFPKDPEFQSEIEALVLCNGEGMENVIELDRDGSVMLIEKVKPGMPLSAMEDDSEATKIIALIMSKIHKPLPANHKFPTVAKWAEAFPKYYQNFPNGNEIPQYLVDRAASIFDELLSSAGPNTLLHGDLHHDNILSSDRGGWLAIDPKGVAGEPAYEVAAMIRNPYDKVKEIVDLEPLLRNRLQIFSKELGIDISRLHKWCLAQTVLSAIWNLEGSSGPEHCVRVATILEKMKV